MFATRSSLTPSGLHAGPLHRRLAELDCRDIGHTALKAPEWRPQAAGGVDFLEHCFITKCVLFDLK
jgi:hypothetical protein